MALYPSNTNTKFTLQPGARGEKFKTNMPGYRNDEERINRTNIRLNSNEHDTLNIKYMFDERLPVVFRYGFAKGFNQMVIPKGRLVSVDPFMDLVDFDDQKKYNTLTLANGGAPVRLRTTADKYKDFKGAAEKIVSTEAQGAVMANDGVEWTPIIGMDKAYSELSYRPFKGSAAEGQTVVSCNGPIAQLTAAGFELDPQKGVVINKTTQAVEHVIPGNIPAGMLIRNEYTRDNDAFNGIAPGAINTNPMVELPWFAYKDKAESNPWGSAYGGLFPGALVKSDENGRVIVSPLSFESEVATMSIGEYELERQQVVGQVYSVNTELVPMGAARWAQWALADRLDFEEINPTVWPENGRRGEDAVSNSPYKVSSNGYPFDKNYGNSDLHMLASKRDNYDIRMQEEYVLTNGIPGLTDGYNAVKRNFGPVEIGKVRFVEGMDQAMDLYFRLPEVRVEDVQIAIGSKAEDKFVPLTVGAKLSVNSGDKNAANAMVCTYESDAQGLVTIKINDLKVANDFVTTAGEKEVVMPVYVKFAKRGLSGVPTFMDWEGCVGSVKILMQK